MEKRKKYNVQSTQDNYCSGNVSGWNQSRGGDTNTGPDFIFHKQTQVKYEKYMSHWITNENDKKVKWLRQIIKNTEK